MAEGGFDLRQNFNFSDSDSEGEEDRMTREVRERLFVFGLDGDISPDRKDSLEVGLQSTQNSENNEAETTAEGSSANHSSSSDQTSSCPALYDTVSTRRRSRTFTFGRLVRRLSRNRRRTDDAYREIEIGSVAGTMSTAGLETAQNSSQSENQTTRENVDSRRRRQRPQSTVVLRPRTSTTASDRRSRRPNSFIDRVCKLFDSTNAEDSRETPSGPISNTESSSTDSSAVIDPGTPTITFPIGVNELVAIRRERARLRVEQTRIEYHLIPDMLAISNCPWYWGKINRFEAERVSNYKNIYLRFILNSMGRFKYIAKHTLHTSVNRTLAQKPCLYTY